MCVGCYHFATKTSTWFCEKQFKLSLGSFFCYYFYSSFLTFFICEYHLLNILLPFEFFFSFPLSFSFLEISSWEDFDVPWTEFQLVDGFCLGYFFERNFILGLKRVQWKIYWLFGMKKHGHISFWVLIAWFSKRLTPTTNFNDSQRSSFFHFLSFYRPIFCLDFPLRAFNLTNSLLFIIIFECLWREELENEIIHTKNLTNCSGAMFIQSFDRRHWWLLRQILSLSGWGRMKAQRGF